MFSITHYQENANENNRISSHTNELVNIMKIKNKCWWEKCSVFLENNVNTSLKKLGIDLLCDPTILAFTTSDLKILFRKGICTPTFISELFKIWK